MVIMRAEPGPVRYFRKNYGIEMGECCGEFWLRQLLQDLFSPLVYHAVSYCSSTEVFVIWSVDKINRAPTIDCNAVFPITAWANPGLAHSLWLANKLYLSLRTSNTTRRNFSRSISTMYSTMHLLCIYFFIFYFFFGFHESGFVGNCRCHAFSFRFINRHSP